MILRFLQFSLVLGLIAGCAHSSKQDSSRSTASLSDISYKAVACEEDNICAVSDDGRLHCNSSSIADDLSNLLDKQKAKLNGFDSIAILDYDEFCGLRLNEGKVYCRGVYDVPGYNGPFERALNVPGKKIVSISGREKRAVVTYDDGSVGFSERQWNEPSRFSQSLPPDITSVVKAATTKKFACAILPNRRVKCWGSDKLPDVADLEGVKDLTVTKKNMCFLTSSKIVCTDFKESMPVGSDVIQLASGSDSVCWLNSKGKVNCWSGGDFSKGEFDEYPENKSELPGRFKAISGGDDTICAITEKGAIAKFILLNRQFNQDSVEKVDLDPVSK